MRKEVERAEKVKICIEWLQEHSKQLAQSKNQDLELIRKDKHRSVQFRNLYALVLQDDTIYFRFFLLFLILQLISSFNFKASSNPDLSSGLMIQEPCVTEILPSFSKIFCSLGSATP